MDSSLKHGNGEAEAADRRRRRREERRRQIRRRRATALLLALAVVVAGVAAVAVLGGADAGGAAPEPSQPSPSAVPVKAVVAKAARAAPSGPPLELAAVGDMTFGRQGDLPSGGSESILRGVAPLLAASDFTLGNLETTLGSGGASGCRATSTNCFSFQASSDTAGALRRAGFDAVNVGNNHANDYGPDGQAQTTAALRAARLPFTGRPGQITYVRVQGIRIALLGFAPYPFAQNLLDVPAASALVRKAARNADLVVVLMHIGAEGKSAQHVRSGTEIFLGENRGDPKRFTRAVVDAGADVVLGSGPHVLRGLEWYQGPADRAQPRQLLRLPDAEHERDLRDQRDPPGDAEAGRDVRRGRARAAAPRRERDAVRRRRHAPRSRSCGR